MSSLVCGILAVIIRASREGKLKDGLIMPKILTKWVNGAQRPELKAKILLAMTAEVWIILLAWPQDIEVGTYKLSHSLRFSASC